MKTKCSATRIAIAFGLVSLGVNLATPPASAGLFHRRTVVVEAPTVYIAPVPTVYAAPVSTIVSTPLPTVYSTPVIDSAVVPTSYPVTTSYVPTVSTSVISTPVTTTYIPTVTTAPLMVVPTTRVRVIYPRRFYLFGY